MFPPLHGVSRPVRRSSSTWAAPSAPPGGARRPAPRWLLGHLVRCNLGPEAGSSGGNRLAGLAELPLQPVSDAAAGLVGDDHPLEVLLPPMPCLSRILLAPATAAAFLAACAGAAPPSDRVVPRN